MIRYTLKCSEDHSFESWFRAADNFDSQRARNLISCPLCGDTDVQKSLMAPRVTTARKKATPEEQIKAPPTPVETPKSPDPQQMEKAIADMRAHVEETSDYVGMEFVDEARKMHDGETETRSIYGEAKAEDAQKLVEEGIPVIPLPFKPKQKMN